MTPRAVSMSRTFAVALVTIIVLGCTSSTPPAVAPPPPAEQSAPSPSNADLALLQQQSLELVNATRFDEALQLLGDAWNRGWHLSEIAYNAACAAARAGKIDDAFVWLERAADTGLLDVAWMNQDSDLVTVRADERYAVLVTRARAAQERHVAALNLGHDLEKSTPAAEGIDEEALQILLARAEATRSSALVLLRNGKLVGEWYWDGPSAATETMSATKSVTSLAVGLLIDEGKIPSVDVPVSTFFPEWNDGVHDAITIRHLLNHTSGLHADRTTEKIYASKDFVRHALDSGVDAPAGSEFFYNNSATNLVAGIVAKASGRPMDQYLRERLFTPLGIREFFWTYDGAGNPHGLAGFRVHAVDLAKIGQLLLQQGMWKGTRLLSADWIGESTAKPSQELNPGAGLLWWLEAPQSYVIIDQAFLDVLRARNADATFITKLEALRDKPIPRPDLFPELLRVLGPDASNQWIAEVGQRRLNPPTVVVGDYDGFSARGSFGQSLVVYPSRNLVAVRLTRQFDGTNADVEFGDFRMLVRALVPRD